MEFWLRRYRSKHSLNIAVVYPNCACFFFFSAVFTEVNTMDTHAKIPATLGYCCCTFFLQLDFLYFIDIIAYLYEGDPKVQCSKGMKT